MDIRHLTKQIENDQINADEKRKHAQQMRNNANGLYGDDSNDSNNDVARKQYLEQEASRQEREADQLEQRVKTAQAELTQKQAKVQELQKDRASKIAAHDQEIARIDQELGNLSGGAFM